MTKTSTSATASAAAKINKPKKLTQRQIKQGLAIPFSHAKKEEQTALPLPTPNLAPDLGMMPVHCIAVSDQVRKTFDEDALRELALDIARHGILQPLTVRRIDDGFLLVAGERRLRAAKLAVGACLNLTTCAR